MAFELKEDADVSASKGSERRERYLKRKVFDLACLFVQNKKNRKFVSYPAFLFSLRDALLVLSWVSMKCKADEFFPAS